MGTTKNQWLVTDGFYRCKWDNGIEFFASVKGEDCLKVTSRETCTSIDEGWHFNFSLCSEVTEITEMEFIQEMQKCATAWERFLTGGK